MGMGRPRRVTGPVGSRILLYGLSGLGTALAGIIALLSVGRITPLLLLLTVVVVVLGFAAPPVVDWLNSLHVARVATGQEAARRELVLAGRSAIQLREHFGPRGRGILPSSVRSGLYFTGRSRVLAELTAWSVNTGDMRARVVTGPPGSGKSAVLGRLISLADARARGEKSGPEVNGGQGSIISAAVLARGSTVDEVAAAVARSLHLDESTPGGLLSALRESWDPRPATIVVDAVDEAADPLRLIIELLEPLAAAAARTKVRLLVGTRRGTSDNLLRLFGASAVVIDLDSPEYFDPRDVEEYVFRTLAAAADPQVATPYRDQPGPAAAVAAAVSARAGGSFLVAQLTALALAAAARPLDVTAERWSADLPATVEAAMERYLSEVKPSGRWLRDLLMALAWSQGDGLDDNATWAALATAIGTSQYTEQDVARLLLSTSAVDLLQPTRRGERTAFRLFHESLAEYLRRESCQFLSRPEVERRLAEAIVARVPVQADGTRDWPRADSYTRTYLPVHAAAGKVLDGLLSDAGFLVTAEPGRLLAALPTAQTARGRQLAQIIQRVGQQLLVAPPGEQACYLEMAAQMAGDALLAAAVAQAAPARPWSVPWAEWQPLDESQLLGHHDDYVVAVGAVETPGGTVVVSASQWTLRAWTLPAGTPVAVGLGEPGAPITGMVAFAEAGRVVAVLLLENGDVVRSEIDGAAPSAVIARQRTGERLWLVEQAGLPLIVTLSTRGVVEVLSCVDGHPCELPAVNLEGCRILDAANVGQRIVLAVTSDQDDDPAEVTVWDLAAGTVLGQSARLAALFPAAHPAPVWAAAFSERAGDPLLLCGTPVFTWDPLRARGGDPVYGDGVLSALVARDGDHRDGADEVQCWGTTRGISTSAGVITEPRGRSPPTTTASTPWPSPEAAPSSPSSPAAATARSGSGVPLPCRRPPGPGAGHRPARAVGRRLQLSAGCPSPRQRDGIGARCGRRARGGTAPGRPPGCPADGPGGAATFARHAADGGLRAPGSCLAPR